MRGWTRPSRLVVVLWVAFYGGLGVVTYFLALQRDPAIAQLIDILAKLSAWPLVAGTLALVFGVGFQAEISAFILRMRRARGPGFEFEAGLPNEEIAPAPPPETPSVVAEDQTSAALKAEVQKNGRMALAWFYRWVLQAMNEPEKKLLRWLVEQGRVTLDLFKEEAAQVFTDAVSKERYINALINYELAALLPDGRITPTAHAIRLVALIDGKFDPLTSPL